MDRDFDWGTQSAFDRFTKEALRLQISHFAVIEER